MKSILILIILFSLIFLTLPAQAVSTVNIQPPTQNVVIGDQFIIYVNMTPGAPIAGMQTNIKFDPSYIRIDSIIEGNLFTKTGFSTFFSAGQINNSAGTVINIFDVLLGPYNTNVSGSFIEIHGTASALRTGLSNVGVYNLKIARPDGTSEPVAWTNATITGKYPAWDVNQDGIINIQDLQIVASHFGESSSGIWDINKDNTINIFDLRLVGMYI